MQKINQEYLKSILHYNPETGVFCWKVRQGRVCSGEVAGSEKWGYTRIKINSKEYLAHRLAFLYMTGAWPKDEIDHINHVRDDNRFVNLRSATRQENAKNLKMSLANTSGVTGVNWHKATKKWKASIWKNGKTKHLGGFSSIEAATQARKMAEIEENYHPNHGRQLALIN